MTAMRPQARRVAPIADAKSGAASWVRHKCAANLLHFGRAPGYPDLGRGHSLCSDCSPNLLAHWRGPLNSVRGDNNLSRIHCISRWRNSGLIFARQTQGLTRTAGFRFESTRGLSLGRFRTLQMQVRREISLESKYFRI
jgi:hypothetical protein